MAEGAVRDTAAQVGNHQGSGAGAEVEPPTEPSPAELRRVGLAAGLAAVGFTTADVLEPARSVLPLRRRAGLAGTMQFTYRNPERSTDPGRILPGARSLVVGVCEHHRALGPRPAGHQGRVARYAGADAYQGLGHGLSAMAEVLGDAGFAARVVADSNSLVDRNAAWRAGLGWWGKNTNLLTAERGSFVVLGAVVTDAVVSDPDSAGQPQADGCGRCTACIDECPTGALVAPGVLDARRCIAWLVQSGEPIPTELRPAVGDRLYGCDVCQEVCPPNTVVTRRRQVGTDPAGDQPPVAGEWVDLDEVLGASDEELLSRHGSWYIADRDPDVIRRTALVILGNTATGSDPAVHATLACYLEHPNPLLRRHAVWAARRLGLEGLAARAAADPDPDVRGELAGPVSTHDAADGMP